MKKLSVLFAAVMMFVAVGVAKAQKVASLDVASVLSVMPEKIKLDQQMKTLSDAKKAELEAQVQSKIAIAKAAKDETMKWDEELAKIKGGFSSASADQGPTNPKIEELKKKVAASPEDTTSMAYLAQAYQEAKNWNGAVLTWQKLTSLLPDWAPAYISLAYAFHQSGNTDLANGSYQKYIDLITKNPADVEANKESLSYAYFAIAYANRDSDKAKAKEYADKAVVLNPTYQDAANLVKYLNK